MNKLFTKITKNTSYLIRTKFIEALFTNNFKLASDLLLSESPESKLFMENAALSGCIIAAGEQSEALTAHLKSIALSLFLTGKFMEGAIFMRVIKQDKQAADYLIEYKQFKIAKMFIRLLEGKEKKELLIKLAINVYQLGKKKEAMYLFASAKEFHPVIHIASELGMVIDSFFIKRYCKEKGCLTKFEKPIFMEFETLTSKIDSDFIALCAKLGIARETLSNILMY